MTSPNLNVFSGRPRGRRLSTSSSLAPKKSRMPSLFNIIRLGVYTGILICTAIVLGIAAHFQAILVSSDLTHFVPFAIFVSCASLLVILALLVSTFFKQKSRISTRIELACLGFLAVVWLALGSFLAASASAEADVECFSADSTLEDPVELHSFTTDIFHAQYRVLEAFSIFNIILVWGFLLFLLFLVLRQHFRGNKKVWMHPVPVYPWFSSRSRSSPHMNSRNKSLPAPVTAMPSRRKGSTRRPHAAADVSKPKMAEYRKSAFWVWVERPREVPAARTRAQTRDRERERDREHERAHERRRGEPSNPPRRTHSSRRPAQK
ncbi:uncharacterized protein FOMMEDRAFT_21603 [Fomitiporia mediterranea MF3/22]|uniref:uncharacterized protein n=1 Tax=Fomitiporia mediterranea (strain MF3/22) TaxID=694068 RepID=UPI0004407B84|nr:uncharacterized protein FOMMEDRAFT_21603 [Fomitiporia mediterranea MF3/22]EJD01159.1 hypothetical protein FOMMEDRAFT_21603 [Fomitiporia mediterranea MF3/22]